MKIKKNIDLLELSNNELLLLEGGVLSSNTSFVYDVCWYTTQFVHALVYMGESAQGNPHI